MSDLAPEHAAVLDRLYTTWRDEGFEGLRPLMHDSIEWQPAPGAPEPGPFRGPDMVAAVAGSYIQGFGKFRAVPNRIFPGAEPDEVLVLATLTATEREVGNFTVPIGHLIKIRDDRVLRFEEIADQVEALAAAGIDPDTVTPPPTRVGGVVETLITSFNDHDTGLAAAMFSPDAEIQGLRSEVEGTVYRGTEGARQFISDLDEVWGGMRVSDPEVLVRKNEALATMDLILEGRGSGVTTERRIAIYVEIDYFGLVRRFITKVDVDAALREFEAG